MKLNISLYVRDELSLIQRQILVHTKEENTQVSNSYYIYKKHRKN